MEEEEFTMPWTIEKEGGDFNVFYGDMHSIIFHNDTHSTNVLDELKVMFDDSILTDVILCIDGHKLACHRFVLAAFSPYFKAMFTMGMSETNLSEVDLYEVDYESVSQLVSYAYTGSVGICRQNVQNLLAAASLFEIMPVHNACAKFLETQLDCSNCLGIHAFAQIHSCTDLMEKAWEHIEKNFTAVSRSEEFLNLSLDQIIQIISSDELNVEKEEVIFEAVFAWIMADEKERKSYLNELFPLVRIGLLSLRFMQDKVVKNKLILDNDQCSQIVSSFHEYETNPHSYRGTHTFSLSLRSGMIKPEHCILLLAGLDNKTPFINCFNPLTRETFVVTEFPSNQGTYEVDNPASTITDKGVVYTGGGNYVYHSDTLSHLDSEDSFDEFDECEVSKDFYRYDNDHNCWSPVAPMLFPKSNFTLAALGTKIYCFGGVTENQHPTEIIEVNSFCYEYICPLYKFSMIPINLHNMKKQLKLVT